MKKHYWYFIGGMATVFIPVGALYFLISLFAMAVVGTFAPDDKSDIHILATNTSPSGKYIATTFTTMGGGAAGSCGRQVNIRKSEEEFNHRESIFSSNCGTEIKTEWENENSLAISYSTDGEILSLSQKSWNADKTVKIIYKGK